MIKRREPFALSGWQKLAVYAVLLALCVPAALPFVWMVSTSLKPTDQIFAGDGSITLASFIPKTVEWGNYPKAMSTVPFATYLQNTLALCAITVFGAVLSSATVAYGFARIPFKGSKTLFVIMISTMALPGQVTMVPVFALFRYLGWYGTYLPLTVPAFFGAPFYIFLLTQFFRSLPEEMAESARVDGAGEWTIFTRLVLPLSKSALATCALFQFLGTWNDFFGPLLYINEPNQYTLGYGLQQFLSSYGSKWAELMAASTIFTLPIVVLFFLAQKTFIRGISTTGGK
ncbi:carbohydrate ABC transporter permease [bacterium]|nr:MAG: carbohydrate ABC transporter permease [bacterium]